MPDIYHETKRQDPNANPVALEDEEKDSNAEYAKMEYPHQGTYKQRIMQYKLKVRSDMCMQHEDLKQWPCGYMY